MINASSPVIDIGQKTLAKSINDAYSLQIDSYNNGLDCKASINVHDLDNSIAPAEMISLLHQHGINNRVDLEQVALFCEAAAQGEDPENHPIASGIPPQQGKDGWFELLVTTGREQQALEEDEKGRIIDFKAIQSFNSVTSEQVIGIIHPPTPGSAGETVSGAAIETIAGKVSPVTPGNGTRFDESGQEILATQEGRVIFEKSSISVVEELLITGDIDMSIGHISFNGFVSISGDVIDDFNVSAQKGIQINGAVGRCQIESDGPVTIGSMAGMGKGKVRCHGDFSARYLNQVTVECYGDISILQEARNAVVKATGKIKAEKALITGGEAVALEGIEARRFGNLSGVKTSLTAGVYFPETDHLRQLRYQLKSSGEQIDTISRTLDELDKKPLNQARRSLREAVELRIGILTQRRINLAEEKEETTTELATFDIQEHPTANAKINAFDSLLEGVVINLGETTEELKHEVAGPVSIGEDAQSGSLCYRTYSALAITPDEPVSESSGWDSL